ncbi:uncharacterized protein LOC110116073 [Dendrobium catenatum]|uniref:uncharacterized protein LOC110116073 n=1 Tax=Dendrobium catenatum TaxID=906689 RepID=UPI0009F178FA|nr:uncharacterized protein LOC110116073 [Dendrobium catenatum]
MADATMTTSHMCYMCRQRVNPVLEPELKCLFCDCGFVKEIAGREATESEDAGSGNESDTQASKKKRAKKMLTVTGKGHHVSPSKSHILEDVLKHQYVGSRRIEELKLRYMNVEIELTKILDDWNNEFMKIKYIQEKYKKMYDDKINEMKLMEEQLIECRAELAIMKASASLHNQQMNRLHIKLVDTPAFLVTTVHAVILSFIRRLTLAKAIADHCCMKQYFQLAELGSNKQETSGKEKAMGEREGERESNGRPLCVEILSWLPSLIYG